MEKNQWMKKENILENKMEGQIAKKAAGNCRLQRERSLLALCLALTEGLLLPFTAFSSENMPRYHENYYALLSPVGEWKEGSIVRQYEARGSKSVTDYGTYTKIKNLSNGVDAETNGEQHVFRFPNGAPESLFIEGETKEPFGILPWNIAISYELNGVEVDPSVLAGEKGLVRIHVEFNRNPNAQEYAKKNYVLICRANFTMEDILSLKAEKAEVVSLGEKKEVLFVLLPGEEDAFTIEVGTNAFEFDGLQFQMMPLRSAQVDRIKDLQNAKSDMGFLSCLKGCRRCTLKQSRRVTAVASLDAEQFKGSKRSCKGFTRRGKSLSGGERSVLCSFRPTYRKLEPSLRKWGRLGRDDTKY